MKPMILLSIAAVAGCTAQPPGGATIAGQSAGSCIDLSQVTARRVLPPAAVLFETTHGSYRAELAGRCAERADASAIVQTESQSGHLCRDDRIRIFDPVEAKTTGARAFAQCRVVGISPVSAS